MDNSENVVPLTDKAADNGPTTVAQPLMDVYFTGNDNVIRDLQCDEVRYHSYPGYCMNESISHAIWMRRALLNWLREVCDHRNTEPEVLAHTAHLIDRFLGSNQVDKCEYQLVGAACFLISSKLKETIPVSVERMVQYTDFSVTKQALLAKEVVISLTLHWDFSGITPLDFIQPVASFLPCGPELRQLIRKSAVSIFMKILHIEEVTSCLPSYCAAGCILLALRLTISQDNNDVALNSSTKVQELLQLDPLRLRLAYLNIFNLFKPGTVELTDAVKAVDQGPPPSDPQPQIESPPPVDTSTPTYLNQPSSSSTCSLASSSSAGLSLTRPSYVIDDSLLAVPPSPPKNLYAAGRPILVNPDIMSLAPQRPQLNSLGGVCIPVPGDRTSNEEHQSLLFLYYAQLSEAGLL